jgi:hypothetical protein
MIFEMFKCPICGVELADPEQLKITQNEKPQRPLHKKEQLNLSVTNNSHGFLSKN